MNFNSKFGFTLIELMVYIALLGGIVLIAGQAFSDSTKMRVRTQSMLQASQTAGNVGSIFKDDVAQLGAKSAKAQDSDAFDTTHICKVYINPGKDPCCPPQDVGASCSGTPSCCREDAAEAIRDSSSFEIKKGNDDEQDTIIMRRLRYKDASADHPGAYEAVEQVTWLVDADRTLKRACKTLDGRSISECNSDSTSIVAIAENVDKFKLTPAKPCTTATAVKILPSTSESDKEFKLVSRYNEGNFEPLNAYPQSGGETVKLSGFYVNYDLATNETLGASETKVNQVFVSTIGDDISSWASQCKKVTLLPYIEYEISFSMPKPTDTNDPSAMFCPGRDHMAVGFKYVEGSQKGESPNNLGDFQFYPPTTDDPRDTGLRTMRFTTSDTIKNVCLSFTFAFFSPVASSGNIKITDLKLKMIPSSNYSFVNEYDPAYADKKNIKAIKMELSINKNGEAGTETAFIPIPSNGPRD